MNRIILIGNGFDLAHGLKTSYQHFIERYWETLHHKCSRKNTPNTAVIDDTFVDVKVGDGMWYIFEENANYQDILRRLKYDKKLRIKYKNKLLSIIVESMTKNWVDIEEMYYKQLLSAMNDSTTIYSIHQLNKDFQDIKKSLYDYLRDISKNAATFKQEVADKIYSNILNPRSSKILFLNFNYTDTEKDYAKVAEKYGTSSDTIHIHGELSNPDQIIFGYGDELDKEYANIENLNDNNFLDNIKSMKYFETDNYKRLLKFVKSGSFEVFVMGHSCGISDRTLLNMLFEHKNCMSVKPFYHKIDAEHDNYNEIVKNISRNFTDKLMMREKLVPKLECKPLVD